MRRFPCICMLYEYISVAFQSCKFPLCDFPAIVVPFLQYVGIEQLLVTRVSEPARLPSVGTPLSLSFIYQELQRVRTTHRRRYVSSSARFICERGSLFMWCVLVLFKPFRTLARRLRGAPFSVRRVGTNHLENLVRCHHHAGDPATCVARSMS